MSYHCQTLPLLSFFFHLSPFFLCLFVPFIILFQLVSNFKFLSFHISSFYTVHLYMCLYLETLSSRLIEEEFVFTFTPFECKLKWNTNENRNLWMEEAKAWTRNENTNRSNESQTKMMEKHQWNSVTQCLKVSQGLPEKWKKGARSGGRRKSESEMAWDEIKKVYQVSYLHSTDMIYPKSPNFLPWSNITSVIYPKINVILNPNFYKKKLHMYWWSTHHVGCY